MKVRYTGTENPASFVEGKTYSVLETVNIIPKMPLYKIKDELGDTALYPWCDFEVADPLPEAPTVALSPMPPDMLKERLSELAAEVSDSYPDFVAALPLFAKAEGVAPQIIRFMEDNPDAKSDEVLDYLDKVSGFDGTPLEVEEEGTRRKMGRVKYVGSYYKVAFEKDGIYNLIEITEDGFYKVYSDAVDDWCLCNPKDFERVD